MRNVRNGLCTGFVEACCTDIGVDALLKSASQVVLHVVLGMLGIVCVLGLLRHDVQTWM